MTDPEFPPSTDEPFEDLAAGRARSLGEEDIELDSDGSPLSEEGGDEVDVERRRAEGYGA